jgi:hypothetical protein
MATSPVQVLMATSAKSNQIEIVIRTLLAAQPFVLNLQILSGTTDLAPPAIASQNFLSKLIVWFGIKAEARLSRPIPDLSHFVQKSRRCLPGRNLKNRDMD